MIKAYGIGYLTHDPVLDKAENEHKTVSVVNFRVAVNEYRRFGDEKRKTVHYFDLQAWDSAAHTIVGRCKQGDAIFFEATPRQKRWYVEVDGQEKLRSRVIFRLETFKIITDE